MKANDMPRLSGIASDVRAEGLYCMASSLLDDLSCDGRVTHRLLQPATAKVDASEAERARLACMKPQNEAKKGPKGGICEGHCGRAALATQTDPPTGSNGITRPQSWLTGGRRIAHRRPALLDLSSLDLYELHDVPWLRLRAVGAEFVRWPKARCWTESSEQIG